MREFDTFSEAFRYGVDKSGLKHRAIYEKIPMDAGQFSNIYNGDVKNPQGSTRNKLLNVVDFEIHKESGKWVYTPPNHSHEETRYDSQFAPEDRGIVEEPSLDDLPELIRLRDKIDKKIQELVQKK